MKRHDVLLVGEPLVLFSAEDYGSLAEVTTFKKSIAGAELNVGIGLSRLGHKVNYLTKLSRDDFGHYLYEALANELLVSDYLYYDEDKSTGIMFKNKVLEGDPKTLYLRKNSAASALSLEDVRGIDFNTIKLLHVTGIPPALSESSREVCYFIMEQAKAAGCYITFDPNLRPALWESEELMVKTMNELAAYATVVLPGIEEGERLTGKKDYQGIADFYLSQGVEQVIVKLGGEGAAIKTKDGSVNKVISGFPVAEVVDTVGAGDGFAVGVINGYLAGLTVEEAVIDANAIGAIQVQDASDNGALPTQEELQLFKQTFKC